MKLLTLDFTEVHTIYRNKAGEKVPGVTTVLGMLNKPALLRWAWKLGRDGKELERTRQVAADIGTIAHGLCEAHLRGMELDTTNLAQDQLTAAGIGFARFLEWWESLGWSVVHTEHRMVSEAMQVGGTGDVVARRPDGALALLDLKTSKAIYPEMYVQVASYAAMYEETAKEPIAECRIVRIGKAADDEIEVRRVDKRLERVAAFAALADARQKLLLAGMKL